MKRWLLTSCLLLPRAAAATTPIELSWSTPEGCPARDQLLDELLLAIDTRGRTLPEVRADAEVRKEGAIWRLQLETAVDGVRGTRQLEADSCDGLARAATLVLALAVGEGLARREEARVSAPEPVAPAPSRAPARAPVIDPQSAPAEPHFRFWGGAELTADALGSLAPGARLSVGYRARFLLLKAELSGTCPRSTPLDGGGQARAFSVAGDTSLCIASSLGRLEPQACVTGSVAWLEVEGRGTARDARATVPLYALGPSIGALWLLGERGFVAVEVASRFWLARPQLVVTGQAEQRRVASFSPSGALGGGVRW